MQMQSLNLCHKKEHTNRSNIPFYQKSSIGSFKKLAEICGLTTYCDVEALLPLIKNKHSILEIGAGYGRIIKGLQLNDVKGKISALEIVPHLCQKLRKKFPNVDIYERNALFPESYLSLPYFDAALLMWGSILDFSTNEQQKMIVNISKRLEKSGIVVIDLPVLDQITHYQEAAKILRKYNKESIFFNIPSYKEIETFANKAHMQIKEQLLYRSEHAAYREFYILSF